MDDVAGFFPRPAFGLSAEGLFEAAEKSACVEVSLQFGNITLLGIEAAQFVEDLHKDGEERVHLIFSDEVGFLVDVETDRARGDLYGLLQVGLEESVVRVKLCQKKIGDTRAPE